MGVCAVDGVTSCAPAHSPPVKKNLAGLLREQSDSLQDLARTVVPLSVSEIRRLFWRLVLATQQRVERIRKRNKKSDQINVMGFRLR